MNNPFVSVIMPCRNEKYFISDSIQSLLSNDYPTEKIEILVIDGISHDGTLDFLNEICEKVSNVRVISNPIRIFPAAVNLGVKNATGDYIMIAGAHARYPKDYISKCIDYSIKYNTDNIGGLIRTVPVGNGLSGKLISVVLSSPFGVGNSRFRTGSSEITETDTVFGGCYKKEVFQKYGLFNEDLISTSDYEFNKRIKRGGSKILLVPEIIVEYYTRSTFIQFIRNNVRNGFWAIYPIAVTDKFPVSMRHMIPLVFLLAILIIVPLCFFYKEIFLIFLILATIYLLTALIFSLKAGARKFISLILLPFIFLSLHMSYGLGSLWGTIRAINKKF